MSTDDKSIKSASNPQSPEDEKKIDRTIVMPVGNSAQGNPDRTIIMSTEAANPDRTIRLSAFARNNSKTESSTTALNDPELSNTKIRKRTFRWSRTPKRDVNEAIKSGQKRQYDPVSVDTTDVSATFCDLESRYSMQQFIAQGHHISLYKCRDKILQRPVAMYIPDGTKLLNEEARLTIIRESEICAQLDHPSILPIYGIYTDYHGAIAIPNKLLDGMILRLHLEHISAYYRTHGINFAEERKSQRERLQIFLEICNAIEYAHSRNIMHGNISPRRIFIGEYHEIYVTGWSVARHIVNSPPDSIRLETPEGTRYTAPEYFTLNPVVDTRSDIYSLGMMLYELITLCEPYADLTQEEIRKKLKEGNPIEIEHRFHCAIDSDIRAMILKATAINPQERYQTVKDLSSDVRRYLELEPISLKRQSFSMRYTRFMLKHQYIFSGIVLAILVGIATLITLTLWLEHKHSEEKRMNEQITFKAFASCSALVNSLTEKIEQINMLMRMCRFNAEQLLENQVSTNVLPETNTDIHSETDVDFRKFESFASSEKYDIDIVHKMQPMLFILGNCFKSMNGGYDYKHDKTFLFKIEYIFQDGTVLSYPKTGKISESQISKPLWRERALKNHSPISILPPELADFRDSASSTMVIPFTMPLFNSEKNQIGALVFLLSNETIEKKLASSEHCKDGMNAQYFAILPEGKIVYEMKNGNSIPGTMLNGTIEPQLLKALNTGSGFGKEIRKETNGDFIYCWSRFSCADENFIYLEKIKLDSYRTMMQHEEELSK